MGPYAWSIIAGISPPGLSLSTSGVWTGKPAKTGTYSFTAQVTDHKGTTATESLTISVIALPAITTYSLPKGTVSAAYRVSVKVTGGTAPYRWTRISGEKPSGLGFSINGIWSGTPTRAGTYSFTVQVADHAGRKATRKFGITIRAKGRR
jgi:hypothetical protein